jgi:hypothetical protein
MAFEKQGLQTASESKEKSLLENPLIRFLTYDDEHHRIAIAQIPGVTQAPLMASGSSTWPAHFVTLTSYSKPPPG